MKRLILSIAIIVLLLPLFAETITPIANIQDSISYYTGRTVTVQGVVTIGCGKLSTTQLKAYLQDDSGRGIMLFDYSIVANYTNNIIRGNLLKVTGKISEYNGVTELTNFTNIIPMDQGMTLPVIPLSITQAQNYQYYEGTFVKLAGTLKEDPYFVGGGANITILDAQNNQIAFRVWPSTGIDYSILTAGMPIEGYGVVSPYNSASQILPGYQSDFVIKLTEPLISQIQHSPEMPFVDQQVSVSAKVVDYNGTVDSVKVFYRLGNETEYSIINMNASAGHIYTATLPAFLFFTSDISEFLLICSFLMKRTIRKIKTEKA